MKKFLVKYRWLLAALPPAVSLFFYWVQGGIGGGHGPYDRLIVLFSLPYSYLFEDASLESWPILTWLFLLPLIFNILTVEALFRLFSYQRRN